MSEENSDEMVEVNVTEMFLDDEEIDELIENLNNLKASKKNFSFDLDEDNELLVHHVEDEE